MTNTVTCNATSVVDLGESWHPPASKIQRSVAMPALYACPIHAEVSVFVPWQPQQRRRTIAYRLESEFMD